MTDGDSSPTNRFIIIQSRADVVTLSQFSLLEAQLVRSDRHSNTQRQFYALPVTSLPSRIFSFPCFHSSQSLNVI